MQNCKWTKELVTLGIAVVALANSLAPSKAQAQENFAWITNTNGVTWKKEIDWVSDAGRLGFSDWDFPRGSDRQKIAEIVVPEHANLVGILAWGCVNLTNIILQPANPRSFGRGLVEDATKMHIRADGSGLRTITCKKTMRDLIHLNVGSPRVQAGEWVMPIQVQWIEELKELPKMEIRTHSTDNGPEVEIIWREGNLQIADAVNGKWKDYSGDSPLRIPLWLGAKPQQFFRIRKGDE